mgnify:CR=1 FL=1
MLQARVVRELFTTGAADANDVVPLSAASGLVSVGSRLFVIADDENHLAVFDLTEPRHGAVFPLLDGTLPSPHAARKAAKPDFEALLHLPGSARYPGGALAVLGSGSRPTRQRAALAALDAVGRLQGPPRVFDLAPLYEPMRTALADLNIEGAFVSDDRLCLLQRGHAASGFNACIVLRWPEAQAWFESAGYGPAPVPISITPFELGAIDGVPLSFTDGAAMPDGRWLFSAAAENTADSYQDGACAGSAVGIVEADGTIRTVQTLSLRCKVEGIAVKVAGDRLELLMVTDADDRQQPARLLSASLRL